MKSPREKLRAAAERATPGEWEVDPGNDVCTVGPIPTLINEKMQYITHNIKTMPLTDIGRLDADHIATASPQNILKLLDSVDKLVEALKYTQRTDVRIGHTEDTENGVLRGMPDKIMMRNTCREALKMWEQE